MGPRWLRGWLFKLIPSARTKRILHVVDTMDSESRKIYNAKKSALEAGDDTILHQVGEGKDIMSILRKVLQLYATRILTSRSFVVRENMKASEADRLPEAQVIGQMSYVP